MKKKVRIIVSSSSAPTEEFISHIGKKKRRKLVRGVEKYLGTGAVLSFPHDDGRAVFRPEMLVSVKIVVQ